MSAEEARNAASEQLGELGTRCACETRALEEELASTRAELQRMQGALQRSEFALKEKQSDYALLGRQVTEAEVKIDSLRTQVVPLFGVEYFGAEYFWGQF